MLNDCEGREVRGKKALMQVFWAKRTQFSVRRSGTSEAAALCDTKRKIEHSGKFTLCYGTVEVKGA